MLKSFIGWGFQINQSLRLPSSLPLFQYTMYSFAIFFNTSSNQSEKNYFLQTSLTDALIYLPWLSLEDAVFSLNFSSAGKGPFMAGKAKNAPEAHFPGGNVGGGGGGKGSEVRDMFLPSLRNLRAKFSEMSFPHLKTYFTQIGCCYL